MAAEVIEIKRYSVLIWRAPSGGRITYNQQTDTWCWIDSVGNFFVIGPRDAAERLRRLKEAGE